MSSKGKGKEVVGKGSSGKRKRDDDKTGNRKRINREVLQFFEDAAGESSDYDTSDFEDDFQEDEPEERSEPGKSQQLSVFPKEEELSGDELERVLEERYRSGSGFVKYAEDDFETKRVNRDFAVPSAPDPYIWKVKCKVGRERQTIFCLMQKYVDLKSIGTKLQISSAFSIDHVKGFVFVEAYKQFEVMEACRQLPDVYYSMISSVPKSELSQLLTVRRKQPEVTKGMWVRVKNGNYKGDLAQVVAVNESRRKATVKLIPRVDFQALAAKFGSGSSIKRAPASKPRLIASSELEEFRPLIQYRRDRDTGINFEVLDGLMLKDGFLYKKVSIDSLRLCDVNPSAEEVQKFRTPDNDNSGNLEFLSQLYGEKKEKSTPVQVQGGGKGEGTSGSKEQEGIEVHDLVLFGKREFGMVIGLEKDETYKILKYGSEGSVVISLGKKDLKNLHLERKFTAFDHRSKNIFVSDAIRVLDGPLKDREGVIKQIYRGIIFIYDQNDMEDNAYFCARSQCCEKIKQNDDMCVGKNGEAGPSGCEVSPSSPKSPLSPEKPWQMGEQNREFNRREKEGMFSVGQSLRIRVGPLKGYLCRVMAVRRSDVTVKLDSRQKVLTVKSEHLSEVRGKSFATSTCDDAGLDSSRPFDFLGNQDGGNDWMAGSAQTADGNDSGPSNERSSWPAFPSSEPSLPWGADSQNASGSSAAADAAWQKKPSTTEGGSGWGVPKVDNSSALGNDASASWGRSVGTLDNQDGDNNPEDPWNKGKKVVGGTSGWGNVSAEKVQLDPVNKGNDGWGQQSSWDKGKGTAQGSSSWGSSKELHENVIQDSENAWGKSKSSQDKDTSNSQDSWGKAAEALGSKGASGGWGSQPQGQSATGGWGKGSNDGEATKGGGQTDNDGWGKPKPLSAGSSWGRSDPSIGEASDEKWGDPKAGDTSNRQSDSWKKPNSSGSEFGASSWSKSAGNSAWGQSSRSEDDQGFSGGRGFGGRRGRGNFDGRGRGRSFGRGQSSWNKDGRDGTSWGNTSDQGGDLGKDDWKSEGGSDDKGWQKPKTYETENKGWNAGKAASDQDNSSGWKCGTSGSTEGKKNTWGAPADRSSDPATGWNSSSSGWGQQQSQEKDKGVADGDPAWGKATEESQVNDAGAWGNSGGSWANKNDGNSAWGKASQAKGVGAWGNSGGSWARENDSGGSKEWKASSDEPENKSGGWGDSGGRFGNNRGRGRGRGDYGGRGDFGGRGRGDHGGRGDFGGRRGRGGYRGGRDQSSGGRGRSFGGRQDWNNEGDDNKPSWGSSFGGNSDDGGGSWGKDKGGSWGNSSAEGNSSGSSWGKEKGGGGWGNSSARGNDQSSGWGKGSAGNDSWGKQKGGGGWGNDSAGGNDQNSGWGKGGARNDGDSCWGKIEDGSTSGGAWGNSPGGNSKSASGWGSSSGGKIDEAVAGGSQGGGGWGKPSAGSKNLAGGWGSSSIGKSDETGAGGPAATGGWGNSSGGNSSSAGGWGSSSGGKNDKGGSDGGAGSTAGWGSSSGGNGNSSAGGWGSPTAGKSDEAGVGGSAGSTTGWGSSSAGGWGSQPGGKVDKAGGVSGVAGSTGGWGSSSGGNSSAGGWGGKSGGMSDESGVGAGSAGGLGSSSGENSTAGGWGSKSGGKSDEAGVGGGAGSTAGWGSQSRGNSGEVSAAGAGGWGNSSGGNNSAGGWGSSSGGKNDEGGSGGGAGSAAGWGKNSSGGNGSDSSAGGWGSSSGGKTGGGAGSAGGWGK